MTRLLATSLALGLSAMALVACDPYAPDLGDTPFRCEPPQPTEGDVCDPDNSTCAEGLTCTTKGGSSVCTSSITRCPEGYSPVTVAAPVYCECQRRNPDTPAADASTGVDGNGMFTCNADPNEGTNGNNSISTATPTVIDLSTAAVVNDVSICPDGTDVDVYSMNIRAMNVGKTLVARVDFDSADGELQLQLLNSGGTVVGSSMMFPSYVTASLSIPATGTYYVRVQSVGGAKNNYDLQLSVN